MGADTGPQYPSMASGVLTRGGFFAAVFAAIGLWSALAPGAANAARRCDRLHTTTVASTPCVRVYTDRGHRLIGCLRRTDHSQKLADPRDGEAWYPSVDASGYFVGFAADINQNEGCPYEILVIDLRARPGYFPSVDRQDNTVGSLRVTNTGAIAWIGCFGGLRPDGGSYPASVPGVPASYCSATPSGADKGVFAYVPGRYGNRTAQLDAGAAIDPTSLGLRGHTLSWRHGGQTRTMPLPADRR